MGSYAASGGYWISTYSDRIFAEPTTITGSIGVFGIQFDVQKLANNFGVTFDSVKTGKFADAITISRPKTEEEIAVLQRLVDWIYGEFISKVAEARKLAPERVEEIAQGRVWSGVEAKEIGLVDELGGLDRAVALAKQRAKIAQDAEVELVIYPPKKSFYDLLRDPLGNSDSRASTLASLLGFGNPKIVQALAAPLQVFRRGEPLALMPNVFVR